MGLSRLPARSIGRCPAAVLPAILAAALVVAAAQQPVPGQPIEPPLPRYRAGANLVRLDAYVSLDGRAVTDLTKDDFEVFEDDRPQQVEAFELVGARRGWGGTTPGAPAAASIEEQREAARDPEARVFVLFLDRWHVGLSGSARAIDPVAALLDKVVGPGDLVSVMTPDISPQNMTLVRKGAGIDRVLRDVWYWGERDRVNASDPREADLQACFPDVAETAGMAKELIERRRERRTLRALESLIGYLDSLREERKFVVLLSEGWVLYRRDERLGRPIAGRTPGGAQPLGPGPDGRAATVGRQSEPDGLYDSCERERLMLAFIDHELEVRQLAQRANRANVSFYPVDPRGLTASDDSVGPFRPSTPEQDRQRLANRQNGLRELAEQTDGAWVLNTNDTAGALTRLLADTGSYYLLGYYSTNTKLDGRFRRITVRVKRPGVVVRARPGYLAPTEAEARAAGVAAAGAGAVSRAAPPEVARALDALTPGRGALPVRVQASGLVNRIRAVVELDPATARQPEWQAGGTLQITFELDRGGAPTLMSVPLPAGQRSVMVTGPDADLAPGRYLVRVEGRPGRGAGAIRATTSAIVGAAGATIGSVPLVLRRGPTTGLAYQPTADPRFRRTERIRAELPVFAAGAVTATGRVLTREGQPLPLQVAVTERTEDASGTRFLVADVTLAPLAQGDYVLEVQSGKESATYGFRVVP